MAKIHNPDTIKRILNDAGIQTAHENTPQELASKVVPVLISNPKTNVNLCKHTATGGTIYTTPTDRDFFLTSASMSNTSHNQNTSIIDIISATPKGAPAFRILACAVSSGAGADSSNSISQTFNPPILLERGSIISGTAVASLSSQTITGILINSIED